MGMIIGLYALIGFAIGFVIAVVIFIVSLLLVKKSASRVLNNNKFGIYYIVSMLLMVIISITIGLHYFNPLNNINSDLMSDASAHKALFSTALWLPVVTVLLISVSHMLLIWILSFVLGYDDKNEP